MHVPSATYRLQLNAGCTFADARRLLPYLERLGVSDLYVSPVTAARPGSAHGYDVIDPARVSPELGGARGLRALSAALRRRGMGLLLDIVPNHLAAVPENPWWADVLARGRASPHARVFDIDWPRSDAAGRLVYRRFFDIDHLVGVRVEDPALFDATHRLALDLVRDGTAAGLRIDHIDGLRDPLAYLRRLRRRAGRDVYLLVEKVLTGAETLPAAWPVAGTTGYDFLHLVNGLFVDPAGLERIEAVYRRAVPSFASRSETVYQGKKLVLRRLFAAEVASLASEMSALIPKVPEDEALRALEEVTARLPVYRTYVRAAPVAGDDRAHIEHALREARRRAPDVPPAAFDALRRVLLLRYPPRLPSRTRDAWLHFVLRWQQYTGGATAKGLEDTALYNDNRLIATNDVGADPDASGALPLRAFHARMRDRLARLPHTMNATSTHDTKRGEDARTRIDVLSELPEEWARRLRAWGRLNRGAKMRVRGRRAPDANDEVLLYQTLLGAWPAGTVDPASFRARLRGYVVKALRESKRHTSWRGQDAAYEAAALGFVDALLRADGPFLRDFLPFQRRVAFHGAMRSLSQVVLKVCAPGLPDLYQGTELWDLSMVDPDNRRPVDFALRADLLDAIDRAAARDAQALARELLASWSDGRIKLFVTSRALRLRRDRHALFARGAYRPLFATGAARDRIVAFARHDRARWAIAVATRGVARLAPDGPPVGEVWGEDALVLPRGAPRRWRDVCTGATVPGARLPLRGVLASLPVALLVPD